MSIIYEDLMCNTMCNNWKFSTTHLIFILQKYNLKFWNIKNFERYFLFVNQPRARNERFCEILALLWNMLDKFSYFNNFNENFWIIALNIMAAPYSKILYRPLKTDPPNICWTHQPQNPGFITATQLECNAGPKIIYVPEFSCYGHKVRER